MAAGLGASCSTPQDAQHLAIFLVAPVVIPAMSILPLLQAPNGVFATAMSLIPPFTPMVMLLRQALPGGVPAWQPWAGLVGVVACTFGITWAAARIFRVGILSQGKLPKMGELVRWAARG
jgi:ABC-2 type transport system permease protein